MELTGNACFRHVLFKLLMYFMAAGVYGNADMGAVVLELFIKGVSRLLVYHSTVGTAPLRPRF